MPIAIEVSKMLAHYPRTHNGIAHTGWSTWRGTISFITLAKMYCGCNKL